MIIPTIPNQSIVTLKLVSGEEIVATLVSKDSHSTTIKNAYNVKDKFSKFIASVEKNVHIEMNNTMILCILPSKQSTVNFYITLNHE